MGCHYIYIFKKSSSRDSLSQFHSLALVRIVSLSSFQQWFPFCFNSSSSSRLWYWTFSSIVRQNRSRFPVFQRSAQWPPRLRDRGLLFRTPSALCAEHILVYTLCMQQISRFCSQLQQRLNKKFWVNLESFVLWETRIEVNLYCCLFYSLPQRWPKNQGTVYAVFSCDFS